MIAKEINASFHVGLSKKIHNINGIDKITDVSIEIWRGEKFFLFNMTLSRVRS